MPLSSPIRHATGTSTAAPTAHLLHARKAGGTPSSTASLMNRYGMPQRVETAAKAAQARGVTWRFSQEASGGQRTRNLHSLKSCGRYSDQKASAKAKAGSAPARGRAPDPLPLDALA